MLRLLFTTEDNAHQMIVVTDGLDSQLNVFVTENVVGAIEYYKGLGIVIEPGHTYNIGQFKEWCYKAFIKLLAYPEGFGEEAAVLVDIKEEYEYTCTVDPTTLSFAAAGETKIFGVTATKQKKVNGNNSGIPSAVTYTTTVQGEGFTKGSSEYSVVAAVNTGAQRTGTAVVTTTEGNKTATVTLTQLAGV